MMSQFLDHTPPSHHSLVLFARVQLLYSADRFNVSAAMQTLSVDDLLVGSREGGQRVLARSWAEEEGEGEGATGQGNSSRPPPAAAADVAAPRNSSKAGDASAVEAEEGEEGEEAFVDAVSDEGDSNGEEVGDADDPDPDLDLDLPA